MAKRVREVEEFVSGVVDASPNTKIHGVVTSLSPVKKIKSCSYFDGEISDSLRRVLVAFRLPASRALFLLEDVPTFSPCIYFPDLLPAFPLLSIVKRILCAFKAIFTVLGAVLSPY